MAGEENPQKTKIKSRILFVSKEKIMQLCGPPTAEKGAGGREDFWNYSIGGKGGVCNKRFYI